MPLKKSQIDYSILIFILGILIIGLIVIFGYKSITSLSEKTDKLNLNTFINQLRNDVASLKGNYGNV